MKSRALLVIMGLLMALPGAGTALAGGAADGSSFAIRPDYRHNEIYDVYEQLRKRNRPQFITTDLALHTGHLLFDYSLRAIEIDRLYGLADELSKTMAAKAAGLQRLREALPYQAYHQDLGTIQAFFCVAAKILDPKFDVPAAARASVEKDLGYIEEHKGFAFSAVLDNAEDFSQYVPRGHYTRNEKFKRYFKAMMWYGRRMFRVEEVRPQSLPDPVTGDHWSDTHKLAETRQMLLITWMLDHTPIDKKPAIETWNKLYVPTVLFAGRTEDLNPMEVKGLATQVWGGLFRTKIGDEKKLREFIQRAAAFSKPKIDSSGSGRKGFGFMPQRFTPDSYITQCLVTDADAPFGEGVPKHPLAYTGTRKPRPFTWGVNRYMTPPERRFMPRGLDVMAVFGCDEALALLQADGDTEYEGYDRMLAFLRKDVGAMMAERKDENLYYAWLHALQPMMKPITSKHVPACLRSKAWLRKQLATSLASWAELRHDTILYVKQSYTPTARSAPRRPQVLPGYVEPQPEVFRRIGKMVAKMQTGLAALGVMPQGLDRNYAQFASLCETLAEIAGREVAGKPLTAKDRLFIHNVAGRLKSTTVLPYALRRKVLSETDAKMALIADVHTDTNAKQVLEEAVGAPFLLTVQMPLAGRRITLHGAVFSYYEFKHPMDDRLTDEAWQKMLGDPAKRPGLPSWVPVAK